MTPVYFNFSLSTSTVINHKYDFDQSFFEILYRIDNWINEESGWVNESKDAQFINISIDSPLSARSYAELPNKLRNSIKFLLYLIPLYIYIYIYIFIFIYNIYIYI